MAENGIQYSTGNTLNFTTNGTTWATLTSGGTFQVSSISASTTTTPFTTGSVIFQSSGGTLSQNNSNLFWDNTNRRLGVGVTTPSALISLQVTGDTPGDMFTLRNRGGAYDKLSMGWSANGYNSYIGFGGGSGFYLNFINNNGGATVMQLRDQGPVLVGPQSGSRLAVQKSTAPTSITIPNSYFLVDMGYGSGGLNGVGTISFGGPYVNPSAYISYLNQTDGDFGKGAMLFGMRANSSADNPATEYMRLTNTGNLLIGTTTDAGFKLDVNGISIIRGELYVSTSISCPSYISQGATTGTKFDIQPVNQFLGTSGSVVLLNVAHTSGGGFVPTGGTATHTMLQLSSTINQTGSANGITRGLYVNPTISAATDFRAIESRGRIFSVYDAPFDTTAANSNIVLQHSNNSQVGIGITSDGAMRIKAGASAPFAILTGSIQTWFNRYGHSSIQAFNTDFGIYGSSDIQKFRIFNSTGNVLIQNGGTFTDAGYRLDVNGTGRFSGNLELNAGNNGRIFINNVYPQILFGKTGTPSWSIFVDTENIGQFEIGTGAGFPYNTFSSKLFISTGGNIGVGVVPSYKLDVNGTTRVSGATILQGAVAVNSTNVSTGYALFVNGVIGTTSLTLTQNLTMGENYAISNNGSQTIDIDANNDTSNAFFRVTANGTANELFRVNESGNFMIGTTTDAGYKLDVSGNQRNTILFSSTTLTENGLYLVNTAEPNNYTGNASPSIVLEGRQRGGSSSFISKGRLAFLPTQGASAGGDFRFEIWNGSSYLPALVSNLGSISIASDGTGQISYIGSGSSTIVGPARHRFVAGGPLAGSPSAGVCLVGISNTYSQSSTSNSEAMLRIFPTINQTGTASGIFRGINVDPTLNAITTTNSWRSIEWTNSLGWGLYGSGTSPNYLQGNTLIGKTTDSGQKLQVSGNTLIEGSLTATTISATTYQNLPFSGTVTGSGTINSIPKWSSSTGISDSTITDDGSIVTIPELSITTSASWSPPRTDLITEPGNSAFPLYVDVNTNINQITNEGYVVSERFFLNNTFITLVNENDHRAIKIFYNIISDDDQYYRSGDIIANWNSSYATFNQTEYGPVGNQPSPLTIGVPTVQYNGAGSELAIYIAGTYASKVSLKIKYTLL
jgi:hypothetical protein